MNAHTIYNSQTSIVKHVLPRPLCFASEAVNAFACPTWQTAETRSRTAGLAVQFLTNFLVSISSGYKCKNSLAAAANGRGQGKRWKKGEREETKKHTELRGKEEGVMPAAAVHWVKPHRKQGIAQLPSAQRSAQACSETAAAAAQPLGCRPLPPAGPAGVMGAAPLQERTPRSFLSGRMLSSTRQDSYLARSVRCR